MKFVTLRAARYECLRDFEGGRQLMDRLGAFLSVATITAALLVLQRQQTLWQAADVKLHGNSTHRRPCGFVLFAYFA
jgi:hypothetical protein